MDIWFVKRKAFFFAEELIAVLYNVVSEIGSKKEKTYSDAELRALSNEFFNFINLKVSDLKKDMQYRDPEFMALF